MPMDFGMGPSEDEREKLDEWEESEGDVSFLPDTLHEEWVPEPVERWPGEHMAGPLYELLRDAIDGEDEDDEESES